MIPTTSNPDRHIPADLDLAHESMGLDAAPDEFGDWWLDLGRVELPI